MKIPVDWSDERALRALFVWQARLGLAPRFGTLPIAFYQAEQSDAYNALKFLAEWHCKQTGWDPQPCEVRVTKDGDVLMRRDVPRAEWQCVARVWQGKLHSAYRRELGE